MTPQIITDDFIVAPQITLQDVAEIASSGFRSVICNRPDGESADQTPVRSEEHTSELQSQ